MPLTLTVCIPCIQKHVYLLDRCINSINRQILHPNEIIISISSVIDLEKTESTMKEIIDNYPRLLINVIYTKDAKFAGENRNIAIKATNIKMSDIISFIDADDIMYPNRLYAIRRIFELYPKCLGMLHHFAENAEVRNEKWNFVDIAVKKYQYTQKLHFGHPSFRREVFNEFKYSSSPRMQDIKLIEKLLPKYISNLLIYEKKLTCYNSNDSTLYKTL